MRLRILCFLVCVTTAYAHAAPNIYSLDTLKSVLATQNVDAQLALQQVESAEAMLRYTQGVYWNPMLHVAADYTDNRVQPTNPFQSARTQSSSWDVRIAQQSPVGISLEASVGNQWNKYFQAEPTNPLLPFPASYHQPNVGLRLEMDLLKNLFGYLTRREIHDKQFDMDAAVMQHAITQRKVLTSALGLYVQLVGVKQVSAVTQGMVTRLETLLRDVKAQFDRHVVDSADVDRLRAIIAARRADLAQLNTTRLSLSEALRQLVHAQAKLHLAPRETLHDLVKYAEQCDADLARAEYAESLSQEVALAALRAEQGAMQAQMTRHKRLPDMKLHAGVVSTGTDSTLGSGFNEVGSLDRPIYSVGVNFSWPLSARRGRAGAQLANATERAAALQYEQVRKAKQQRWTLGAARRASLANEHQHVQAMLSSSVQRLLDIQSQFRQGRLSLFQLTEEELQHLEFTVRAQQIMQQRVLASLTALQDFDGMTCALVE